jgi:hypothetical protein
MAFARKPKYKDPEPGVPVPEAPMPATAPMPGPAEVVPVAEVFSPPPAPPVKPQAPPAPAVKFYPGDREALEVQVKIITEAARRIALHPTDPLALRRDLVEIEKACKPALIILRRY